MACLRPDAPSVELFITELGLAALLDLSQICRMEYLPVKMYVLERDGIHTCRILGRDRSVLDYILHLFGSRYGHTHCAYHFA